MIGPSTDEPTVAADGADASSDTDASPVGGRLGRYIVLEEIGRGGMGRVLRAYDPKLQREVALKELRRRALSSNASARMVAEARAMAKLSHPNVVAVYDVEEQLGSYGSVALVMELVEGLTLRQWLSDESRTTSEIVKRFVEAGTGLAAAHGAGLLHRDFKPANVLVAGDRPAKVTDFGLAKGAFSPALETSVAGDEFVDDEALTAAGTVVGTPRYMPPEQHAGAALSPAADQYAFCVALWEALYGLAPFSGPRWADAKLEGPPSLPSRTLPRRISDALLRGLCPDPSERFPNMDALLGQLRDDSRRRRPLWLAGGLVATIGLAALGFASGAKTVDQRCSGAAELMTQVWNDGHRANVESAMLGTGTSYSKSVWERTRDEIGEYAEQWTATHTEACTATAVREEQSEAVLDLRMACLQRARVQLDAVVGVFETADREVIENAHEVLRSLPPLEACTDVEGLQADQQPPRSEDAEGVAQGRAELARARAESEAGRYGEAREHIEAARAHLAAVEYGPVHTELSLIDGLLLDDTGQYEAASAELKHALSLAARWHQSELMGWAARELLTTLGNNMRRFEEGLAYRPIASGLNQDPIDKAITRAAAGMVLWAQGRYDLAERDLRAALKTVEDDPDLDLDTAAGMRGNLGSIRYTRGEYVDAEVEFRRALDGLSRHLGPEHPRVAQAHGNLAVTLEVLGRYDEAETHLRTALALWKAAFPPTHPQIGLGLGNLGNLLASQGKLDEAVVEYRRGLALLEESVGPGHPNVALTVSNLATVLEEQGKLEQAEVECRKALELRLTVLGPDHPDVAQSRHNLAAVLAAQDKLEEAETQFRQTIELRERILPKDHVFLANSRLNLARVLLDTGRSTEALDLATKAYGPTLSPDARPEFHVDASMALAYALWETGGSKSRARELAENALKTLNGLDHVSPDAVADVQTWLDEHPMPRAG